MNTDQKKCFKCGAEKPLTEYYKHKAMADGHLNKCKSCAKKDVKQHRDLNILRIRAYDRARGNRQTAEYQREYRRKNREKQKAHTLVAYHLESPGSCELCGEETRLHAHHRDYSKPLDVTWLCPACHQNIHHRAEGF
jgi:hypothetical protein